MRRYFGTDGVRGRVGSKIICPEFFLKLGIAIGTILKKESHVPTVFVGRDTRISGASLQSAFETGLLSTGVQVTQLGVLPTPAIAFFTEKFQATAGAMISASHNLYEDNGLKLVGKNGLKFSDAWEYSVECALETIESNDAVARGKLTALADAAEQYILHCVSLFASTSLKPFHVVLDCANGATAEVAPTIFQQLGATVSVIHNKPNGKNINAHCGATHLHDLQKKVVALNADCGLAFDGDGDRLLMVDHAGETVDGDEILCLLAHHNKHAAIVGTLMSNLGLEKSVRDRGILFERVSVGDRYVLAKLQEKNWRLGGESSGHIVNLDYATTGDGILTGLQILQILAREKKSLHILKKLMQKRPQILINVPVDNPARFPEMTSLHAQAESLQKKLGDSGRVLLRASGTESCIRVMVECNDAHCALTYAEMLAKQVEN